MSAQPSFQRSCAAVSKLGAGKIDPVQKQGICVMRPFLRSSSRCPFLRSQKSNSSVILASYGTFSTGVNIKRIDNIVFASPSKSRIRNLQSIGRGLRKTDGKDSMRLFDISDDLQCDNYTLEHLKERINIYNEENFPYELKQFDLHGNT